jgi:hypothetical protein
MRLPRASGTAGVIALLLLALSGHARPHTWADANAVRLAPNQAVPVLPLAGQVGGATWSAVVEGDRAVLGVGPRLVVIDVSDPSAPRRLGASGVLSGTLRSVALDGDQAYAGGTAGGVWVFDLTDAVLPRAVGYLATSGAVVGLAPLPDSPKHLAVASATGAAGELVIVDASRAIAPRSVGTITVPGAASAVAVSGAMAYVTYASSGSRSGGLAVVDVAQPSSPRHLATVSLPDRATDVFLAAGLAYVAMASGLAVVDIAEPAQPRTVGAVTAKDWDQGFPGVVQAVALTGHWAYLATGCAGFGARIDDVPCTGGLRIVDVSDPAKPRAAGIWSTAAGVGVDNNCGFTDVATQGDHVYGVECGGRLRTFAGALTGQPVPVGLYDAGGPANGVAVAPDRAYVTDGWGLQAFDLSDPVAPAPVTYREHFTGTPGQVLAADGVAYVSEQGTFANNLLLIDPRDLHTLGRIGALPVADLAVRGTYAYVASSRWTTERIHDEALLVFDVSDPEHPRQTGAVVYGHEWFYSPSGLAMTDHAAFLSGQLEPLWTLDVADPGQPRELGRLAPPAESPWISGDIALTGHYALLLDDHRLRVVDVADPAAPRLATTFDLGVRSWSLIVEDGVAYVVGGNRMLAVDVSDPLTPHIVGALDTSGSVSDAAVGGDYVYVAAGAAGLLVTRRLHAAPPPSPTATAPGPPSPTPAITATPRPSAIWHVYLPAAATTS